MLYRRIDDHRTTVARQGHGYGHFEIDHSIVSAIPVVDKAIGVIIGLPAPIDQITELIAVAGRQIDRGAPDAVAIREKGWLPGPIPEIAGDKDPVGPQAGRQLKHDTNMAGFGGGEFCRSWRVSVLVATLGKSRRVTDQRLH